MGNYLKKIESSISTIKESTTSKSLSDSEIIYTMADRTELTNKMSNYFSSFNLPYTYDVMASGTSISQMFPEKFQLNVNKAVFVQITRNDYSEYIDGRSITLNVPQWGGTTKKVVSTFYSESDSTKKTNSDSMLGENISFLFCDDINLPYTGTTDNTTVDRSSVTSWDPTTDFRERPSAVSYKDLYQNDKNSDQRAWVGVSKAVYVPENWPQSLDQGYNYDIPVGFAALDKGYFIITHPDIVDNVPWTSGSTVSIYGENDDNAGEVVITGSNDGATSGTTNIVFTGQSSSLTFKDVTTTYLNSVVCLAMPKEFFVSTNPSWDIAKNLTEIENETYDLDSIYVTQVGLYNIEGDLIAVAKLDRPLEKEYNGILNFNLNIEV